MKETRRLAFLIIYVFLNFYFFSFISCDARLKIKKHTIGKNVNVQHFFLQPIINIVIQVIFQNIITYLDRTFKEEQNGLNFKIK